MARKTLAQRIALEGGAEIEAELKKLGFAGTEAFRKLKAEAEKLTSPLRQMQLELQRVGKSFETFGKNAQRIGRTLSLAITAPIVGGFAASIKAAADFESAMADVRKVVDFPTPQAFKEMGDDLREMSLTLPIAANELAAIAAAAGQAGVPAAELAEFTELVAKASVAFELTADEAGSALAKIKTALGLTTPEVGLLSDAMNTLANNMAASEADVLEVVTRTAALGKISGVATTDIAALGAAMVSMGVESETAATAVRNILLEMQAGVNATAAQEVAWKQLGLTSVEVAQRIQKEGAGAILDVFERIRRQAPHVRVAILTALFDKRAVDAVGPLLNNLGELHKAFGLVDDEAKFAGSTLREFAVRADTASNKFQLFKNHLNNLAIVIGSELLPVVVQITEALSGFLKGLSDTEATMIRWGAVIAGIAAAIGPFVFVLGVLVSTIGKVATAAGGLIRLFLALRVALATAGLAATIVSIANPIGAVLAGLGLLAGAIYVLTRAFSAGSEGAEAHRDSIAKMDDAIRDAGKGVPGAAEAIMSLGEANIEAARAAKVNAEATLKLLKAQAELEAKSVNPAFGIPQDTLQNIELQEQELRNLDFQIDLTAERMAFGKRAAERYAESLKDGVGDANALGSAVDEVGAKIAKFPGPAANVRSLKDSPFAKAKTGAEELGQSVDAEGKKVETAVDGMAAHIRTVPEEWRKTGEAATQAGTATAAAAVTITTEVGKVGVEITRVQPQVEALTGAVAQVPVALAEAGTAATGALEPVNTAFATAAANTTQLSIAATTTFTGIEASAAQTAASLPALFTQAANAIAQAFAAAFARVKAELSGLVSAVNSAISSMNAALARLRAAIAAAKAAAASAKAAAPGGGGGGSGFAGGGHVRGAGSSSSDSILAWLSDGEFVLTARAVRQYGLNFLRALNEARLPKFPGYRDGGLVVPRFNLGGLADAARQSLDGLRPQPMSGLALAGIGGSTGALTPVHLHMPGGQTVIVQAEDSALVQMRRAIIGHKRRSTGKDY